MQAPTCALGGGPGIKVLGPQCRDRLGYLYRKSVCDSLQVLPLRTNRPTHSPGWNCFFDLALALLPITIVWDLQMQLKKKAALCSILGLGILYNETPKANQYLPILTLCNSACISSAIKGSKLSGLNTRSDLTCKCNGLFHCLDTLLNTSNPGTTYELYVWSR